jgi:HK97 family phage portal protein
MTLVTPGPTRSVLRPNGGSLFPPPGVASYGVPGPYVYDIPTARMIPAVARCLQLYSGMAKQMPVDAYRGYTRLPQPRLCARPDPTRGGPWFVQVNVEDYLLAGNAVSLVTSRGADGWPLTVTWLSAFYTTIQWLDPYTTDEATYYYLGQRLPTEDVIHVRRGADRLFPIRGVGIIEEHLSTLDRVAMEEEYERGALAGAGVPSVAVITPQATLTQDVADSAKAAWNEKFAGPQREPVILPAGTQVLPLAWSPTDTQLSEARRLSQVDVANMFNLDGYWLGAPVAGMTYRTAAPQYQQILRTSLEPVLADFEDVWSNAWLPRGTTVRFRRSQLLREDLATSTTAAVAAYGAGIMTLPEARVEIGLPPDTVGAVGAGADLPQPAADVVASPEDPNAPVAEGEPGGPQ